jgi:acyl-CoA thioester hydrolase
MARIKIEPIPEFTFNAEIPVRITDINYGGHVGNDTILSIIHEARVQFLRYHGFGELEAAGVGLIMSDVAIEFKQELFYGDSIMTWVAATEFSRIGFEIFYKLEKKSDGRLLALAKTGMVCYNYEAKKIVTVPEQLKSKLNPA